MEQENHIIAYLIVVGKILKMCPLPQDSHSQVIQSNTNLCKNFVYVIKVINEVTLK